MESKLTTQGDVNGFTILLLEIFAGKMPTNSGFEDELNSNHYVKMDLPHIVYRNKENKFRQYQKEIFSFS